MSEATLSPLLLEGNEDYNGSFCLLHSLTTLYPAYVEVLVDIEDFEAVMGMACSLRRISSGRRLDIYAGKTQLGRRLMGSPQGKLVDHRNRNPFDNRRSNLRTATYQQNNLNSIRQKGGSSQYRGVQFVKGKWIVQAGTRECRVYLGAYASEIEAAQAYNRFAREQYGEFAYQNPV